MIARSGRAALAYDVIGQRRPEVEPVLLVHAGVTDRRSWGPLTGRLAPVRQVIGFDTRGFGETTYEPEPWSPIDDAVAVLDDAGVARAAVVGASMGGSAAIDLTLAHPDRVERLVLIAPAVSGAPDTADDTEVELRLDADIDAADAAGDIDEVNRLEAWMWLDGPAAPEGRVAGPVRDLFLEMNGQALRAGDPGDRVALVPPAWDRLPDIAVPTLVLVGDLDLTRQQTRSAMLAELIPNTDLVQLSGVAHLPHLEADPTCLDAIAAFLS